MKKLEFKVSINAPKEKVWKILWDDTTYREWTSAFNPDSHAKSDWKEGSRIEFLDGKGNGMYAVIDKKVENAQMVFKHIGEIKNGADQPSQGEGFESYFLSEANGKTELRAELDAPEDYEKYFSEVFPKAMEKIRQISEQ